MKLTVAVILATTAASAAVKTPESSRLFEKRTDPSSGVVSYLLKDGLVGKWNQQAFYFVTKSMSNDGRFLLFNVSDDERVHPVTNYIDCAQTKAFIDLEKEEAYGPFVGSVPEEKESLEFQDVLAHRDGDGFGAV